MHVKQILTGGDRNFADVIAEKEGGLAAVIDPSYAPEKVLEYCKKSDLEVRYILNTHDHHDHTNGNGYFYSQTGRKALNYGKIDPETGVKIENNAELPLDSTIIRVIHTPGHTEDSVCYFCGNVVFTGDTIFVGKVGGTDFGDGAAQQYESLHSRLLKLPDNTKVYPGHDVGVKPESTIGEEKKTNPFLLRSSFESFVDLKKNWLAYKEKHGIK